MKWSDYGESSLTILAVYCGLDKASPRTPQDPSDFKRCVHLITCLNLSLQQERVLLNKLKEVYPIWTPFVNNWGKLMGLYIKEKDKMVAFELYEYINKLQSGDI